MFWDQGKEEKVNCAQLNLKDTGSISSLKQNLEDYYVFFPSFFVIESSVFEDESLH